MAAAVVAPRTARPAVTPPVAYVVSLFPCWSETFIVREIHALRERGVPVRIFSLRPPSETLVQGETAPLLADVVYPRPGRAARAILRRPLVWLREMWRAAREAAPLGGRAVGKALYTVAVAADFAEIARRAGVRHLHAHFATFPGLAVRTMRRLTGLPYSLTTHAHDIFLPNPHLLGNVREAHTIATISEYNRRHLRSLGAADERVKIVPCGLDFEALRRPAETPRVPASIIAIGRLAPIKGFPQLIEACALLRDRGLRFTCEVIGGGPLREDLERRVVAHRLHDHVRLLGALDQKDVQAHLLRAEVCVVPSVRAPDGDQDGVPVVLMEAMALEVPVVTTRISGIPELVEDSVSGLLTEPGDVRALADSIERLLGDEALRARLAAGGRRAVRERQDIRLSAARMQAIFRESVNETARPRAARTADRAC